MRTASRALAGTALIYGAFSVIFAATFLRAPDRLGSDWSRQLFYCGAVFRSLEYRQLPFWNPWGCGGSSLWQNPDVPLLAPTYVFAALMPLATAMKANLLLHAIAGVIGARLLLRLRGSDRSPLLNTGIAATAILAVTALAERLGANVAVHPSAFLIPALLYYIVVSRSALIRSAITVAILFALVVYEGDSGVLWLVVAAAAMTPLMLRVLTHTSRPMIGAIVALVAGIGLAAPRLVPIAAANTTLAAMDQPKQCHDPTEPQQVDLSRSIFSTEGPLTTFDRTFSPNRISERVVVGNARARVVLNQNYAEGWTSNEAPVSPDPASGQPSITLPSGYAGRVVFSFTPRGIWVGLTLFVFSAALSVAAWNSAGTLERLGVRVWATSAGPRTVAEQYLGTWDLAIVVCAGAGFLWMYTHYPYRPTLPDNGWWNFWDQSQYLKSAKALARGDLNGREHWYPIGYAVLGAPFARSGWLDPFLPVDLTAFLLFAWLFLRLFQPAIGGFMAIVVFCATLLVPWGIVAPPFRIALPLWSQFAMPWNSNPIAPVYIAVLLGIRWNWRRQHAGLNAMLGVALGFVASIRPSDAVPLGVLLACYALCAAIARRLISPALFILGGALACATPVLLFVRYAYGGGLPPYTKVAGQIGFSVSHLAERAYQILLRSEDTYGEAHAALFELQPWLFLALPLAVVWAATESAFGAFPVLLVLLSWTLYLSFNDFSPFNILRYQLIHYILWTLPVVAAAGLAGAVAVVRTRRWMAGVGVLVVALAAVGLRLVPTPVAVSAVREEPLACCGIRYSVSLRSRQGVDAIEISTAVPGENPMTLANKDLDLWVDGAKIDVLSGYQVMQRADGIRIIFKRNVVPKEVGFTLDHAFEPVANAKDTVRALRFRAAWGSLSGPRPG